MELLRDLNKETTNRQAEKGIDEESSATTNWGNNYNDLKVNLTGHEAVVVTVQKEASKILPWVHIAISIAKRLLLDVLHFIGDHYLESYLYEFCNKLNRRYLNLVFNRMEIASFSCKWERNV